MPTIDATSYHSPNSAPRTKKIQGIVIHHGAGTKKSDLAELTTPGTDVSAHYYVDRAGNVYQLVPDDRVAWHAGKAILAGETDVNGITLGIETEHTTMPDAGGPIHTDWPPAQLKALADLIKYKMVLYSIPASMVVSHRAVATPPGRKSDPGPQAPLAPEPLFRAWVNSLLSAPRRTALPLHGAVLTNVNSLDLLEQHIMAGEHTILKVVASWGVTGGWTDELRSRAIGLTGKTLLRTSGDPASGTDFPHVEAIEAEVAPWYKYRRSNLYVEISNELNKNTKTNPAGAAWHMQKCISFLRQNCPLATIIAGALLLDDEHNPERWLESEEYRAALQACDLIGVHAYWFYAPDDTHQLQRADSLYNSINLPRALTEYGINDPHTSTAVKGKRYADLLWSLPPVYQLATFYHVAEHTTNPNDAAYAFDLMGEAAYKSGL
jgi:hypothetical protein